MAIRVLVADDHKLFRQGLISLINTQKELVEVIGEADSGPEAIRLAGLLRPDIVLMDIYMPNMNGLEATKQIKELYPKISVVMLTSSEADEHLYEAVRLGASGYLLKSLDANELFEMLQGVMRGEAAMTRAMAARLLREVSTQSTSLEPGNGLLTDRELVVLRLIAKGSSNSQIADELFVSVNTVKTHVKNILGKLQLNNRTQVAAYAAQHGLIKNTGK